ncbi:ThuA domain-containing protein [Asanoa sp. WMMD1127]|uniref:LamG-like jellyroll fold domain-containing protein n=1 Tax=Asanoa sp. WMMD1127 TaxID=3016107 RepID=UPI0024168BC0|nr:LamG-like jellyroll fold domain-containing protein [Asanoa sp. WMMD1127]MDG4825162.1 ThuA domain-containing protein [Asanoa sp. WMMD1127]
MKVPRRSAHSLLALMLVVAGLAVPAAARAAAVDDGRLNVLLFYKPNFHASNVQARQAVRDLAAQLGTQYNQPVEIQETDDPAVFNTANLAARDTVVFAQTGGVLFNVAQRTALESYIRGGGGFMGLHYTGWSVGESEHDVNPFYARLVGAASEGHPEDPGVRPGRVFVRDTGHPLTQGVTASLTRSDEWYDWVVNPAPNVRTLIEADESSYGGGRQGTSHPVTWCQKIDSGRSWYTSMGHEGTAYAESYMRAQMKNGLAYAAGLLPADCSPPVKDRAGAWSGVTPWPLVPINMSLTSDGKVQSFGSVGGWSTDATPYDWTGDSSLTQGGQMEVDIWDPAQPRNLANLRAGILPNTTYTDLFCAMQVQNPHDHSTMTVGGDDGLGGNSPNDAAIGVTSYSTNNGLQNKAPMNYPRWYPTGTTMPNGDIVVQGGSLRGGPGGPGVLTPEIYTPQSGSGWKTLDGARSPAAYGDGGSDHAGQDENRWWYPRAFVAPGSGTLFNITGTQMYELNPAANGGTGQVTLRGTLPAAIANQGANGNPVGATSTATMYRPGKILQVGGGWWANGGGPDGARAGFTVDITGGTASPVVTATRPMKYQRHWATSTVLPDGDVLVTGGGRENNGNGGYVTNAEIWDPDSGTWTEVAVPYEHARLYHSAALLLPDGRVMMGGGGTPGPRNYTDVEYYSPAYLFNGDQPAPRPVINTAPATIGYNGSFGITTSGTVSRVTLVRNGSVTHGFNNDQNFQDLAFSQSGSTVTVNAPANGTYAPPGSYMLFVWDSAGTPSIAKILKVDPAVKLSQLNPRVVDQFEYPRLPAEWRTANPPATVDVAAGNTRMSPWTVDSQVQLVRGTVSGQGGLGLTGYQLSLGNAGAVRRTLSSLTPGTTYRVSLRYARDSRSAAGAGAATANLTVGNLNATITATTGLPSTGAYGTYVGTFTAATATQTLTLRGPGTGAGLMIDDLVVVGDDPPPTPVGVPVRYEFEEGQGTSAANTGGAGGPGAAVLTGTTGWSTNGIIGKAVNLPGGSTANAVDLPDNLLQNAANFTTGFWVRPDTKNNWTGLFHIGDGLGSAGSYFQIQMQTQASGSTGLAATFKGKTGPEERVYASPAQDVVANQWNHVAFTRQGSIGTLYLNGVAIASRADLTVDMTAVGPTANNWLGRNGYPDAAFDGLIDDVRVYTSTLTAADVAAMYNEGNAVRYTFDENTGTAAGNSGTRTSLGAATLPATASWAAGRIGSAVNLPGGAATSGNEVRLPNNIQAGLTNQFTVSFWARPDTLPNWVPLLQIGSSTDTFFLLQSATNSGTTGFGATFKAAGAPAQERLLLGAGRDLPLNQWTHVVFTMSGSTAKIYFNGVLHATRSDFPIGIGNVGVGGSTTANFLGGTSWGDPRFDGLIDDFRLYGYELNAEHVTQLYAGRR